MSLRLRLLLALVGLVAVGLLVADGVTYLSLQSFLLQRVDQQLEAAQVPVVRALENQNSGLPGDVPVPPSGERRSATGYLWLPHQQRRPDPRSGHLQLRRRRVAGAAATRPPDVDHCRRRWPGNAHAAGPGHSSLRFRALATQYGGSSYTLIAAIPLTEVTQTQHRLLLVEAIVTLTVLFGLALLAWWIVRRELRPLDDMAATAGAIAAGDLTRRVERADTRTEVGRLGLALNAMLAQIEEAFTRAATPRTPCGGSSPRRRTSCARRSHPSAAMPSCFAAARRNTPKTWTWPCGVSSRKRPAWACWSKSSSCWPAWTKDARSIASPST